MKNPNRKIKVYAVNNNKLDSMFDIYLEMAGKREWLMVHRHNGLVFNLLRNGVSLDELKNMKKESAERVRHVIKVVDEYLEYA